MPIVVECGCGKRFAARDELAGKTLACPACGQSLTVPGAAPAPEPPAAAAAPIVVTCTCGQRFAARAELAGKTLACPKCGQSLTVPGGAAAPPRAAPKAAAPAPPKTAPPKPAAPVAPVAPQANLGDLLDDAGLIPTKTGVRCVKCRADMKPGSVICVQCGYNHETETMTQTKRWT